MSSAEESLEKRELIEKDARQIAEETRDLQLLEEELREQLYVMRSKKEQKQQRIHNQAEISRRHSAVLDDLRKQCRELDAQRNMLKNTIAQNEQASARSRAVRALREQQDSELHERHSAEMRQLRLLTTQADERAGRASALLGDKSPALTHSAGRGGAGCGADGLDAHVHCPFSKDRLEREVLF